MSSSRPAPSHTVPPGTGSTSLNQRRPKSFHKARRDKTKAKKARAGTQQVRTQLRHCRSRRCCRLQMHSTPAYPQLFHDPANTQLQKHTKVAVKGVSGARTKKHQRKLDRAARLAAKEKEALESMMDVEGGSAAGTKGKKKIGISISKKAAKKAGAKARKAAAGGATQQQQQQAVAAGLEAMQE